MNLELEYYLGIIERNENQSLNELNEPYNFIFLCEKFIELMDYLKETYDKRFVKNALITLLGLFNQNVSNCHRGSNIKNISAQERLIVNNILKSELR